MIPTTPTKQKPKVLVNTIFQYKSSYLNSKLTVTEYTSAGNPIVSGIPLWYCATQAGAEVLKAWLKTEGITITLYEDWPLFPDTSGDRAKESNMVWYGTDGKGAKENLGPLLWNFEGLPASIASQIAKEAWTLDDTTVV